MGILAKLFGSDRVIEKATDGIYNGTDKLIYTNEEKIDNFKSILKLYEPFKIAQRFLALVFGIPYAVAWFITFISSFYVEVTYQLQLLNGTIGQINLAIIGFYFLGGAVSSFAGTKKK